MTPQAPSSEPLGHVTCLSLSGRDRHRRRTVPPNAPPGNSATSFPSASCLPSAATFFSSSGALNTQWGPLGDPRDSEGQPSVSAYIGFLPVELFSALWGKTLIHPQNSVVLWAWTSPARGSLGSSPPSSNARGFSASAAPASAPGPVGAAQPPSVRAAGQEFGHAPGQHVRHVCTVRAKSRTQVPLGQQEGLPPRPS